MPAGSPSGGRHYALSESLGHFWFLGFGIIGLSPDASNDGDRVWPLYTLSTSCVQPAPRRSDRARISPPALASGRSAPRTGEPGSPRLRARRPGHRHPRAFWRSSKLDAHAPLRRAPVRLCPSIPTSSAPLQHGSLPMLIRIQIDNNPWHVTRRVGLERQRSLKSVTRGGAVGGARQGPSFLTAFQVIRR